MADEHKVETGAAAAEEKTGFEDKTADELQTLLVSEQDNGVKEKIVREALGRAHRAEAALKDKGTGGAATANKKGEEAGNSWDEYAQLQASGLTPADIVEVGKLAKKYHVTPLEVLADPIMKAGFDATRKKATVGSRTFAPDRRVSSGGSAQSSPKNEKDTPGIASARDAFNRNLSSGGDESSE
jgi:hypothetical protein